MKRARRGNKRNEKGTVKEESRGPQFKRHHAREPLRLELPADRVTGSQLHGWQVTAAVTMMVDADDGEGADMTITAVTVGEAARTAALFGTTFQALHQVLYMRTCAR